MDQVVGGSCDVLDVLLLALFDLLKQLFVLSIAVLYLQLLVVNFFQFLRVNKQVNHLVALSFATKLPFLLAHLTFLLVEALFAHENLVDFTIKAFGLVMQLANPVSLYFSEFRDLGLHLVPQPLFQPFL